MEEILNSQAHYLEIWKDFDFDNHEKTSSIRLFESFIETYQEFLDYGLNTLRENFRKEGPHLSTLPDNILETLGKDFSWCMDQYTLSLGENIQVIKYSQSIIKCLIILCRNYDNISVITEYNFVADIVLLATPIVEELCTSPVKSPKNAIMISFLKHVLHFFECFYDPFLVWRKRLQNWNVDKSHLNFKPATLHVEVIPFFHECFQKKNLPLEIEIPLLYMFGGVMSGDQQNALRSITPATLDVLLCCVSLISQQKTPSEKHQQVLILQKLVLKCIVRIVHVIHCACPDQRQVEVSQVMEGYLNVLQSLKMDQELPENEASSLQVSMIQTVKEMLSCRDKKALQVIFVSGGMFDTFISLLNNATLSAQKAQNLAMTVLEVMNTVLYGSLNAKDRFQSNGGYRKLLEALKSLGQPSISLLKTLLNLVVEDVFDEKKFQNVRNVPAALLLFDWLPDIQSAELQIWLSKTLRHLCCHGRFNVMTCCNEGMIGVILNALKKEKQLNSKAVSNLIHLVEILGTLSIRSSELKQLIGLFRVDEDDKMTPYCNRLMKAMSTMARRDGKDESLHFFCIQEPGAGISLPSIRKWPGTSFSFHTWLCLENELDLDQFCLLDSSIYRKQLYSFSTSSGSGFEAFFTPENYLVVAVYNRKDYCSVCLSDYPLKDSVWHCLDIVHLNSRRPFANSQLMIYVDGYMYLNAQLKFPTTTEPFTSCKVGAANQRSTIDLLLDMNPVSPTIPERRKSSPLKFFNFNSSPKSNCQSGVTTLPGGTQDDIWGQPIALMGQLGSVCVFYEALQPTEIKCLNSFGPNYSNLLTEDGELSDLPGKLLLYYNAKACKDGFCTDLSNNQNHGQLHGFKCVTWDIKDLLSCVGGIPILFPLLELVDKCQPILNESADITPLCERKPMISNDTTELEEDWIVVKSASSAESKLEQNQVAAFLTLLRNMLQTKVTNQDCFIRTHSAATIGALLQKVQPKLIDVHVLMAVQLLVETAGTTNTTLLHQLYQFVLFDFRVWSRSDFPVRIGHIQYLATIIKDDRKLFRKKYGVQYILDVIRTYYSVNSEDDLCKEDAKTIRGSLLGLIKFYILKDITFEEVSQIMAFVIAVKEETLKCEVVEMLLMLMENPRRKPDQLFVLMFEPDMCELLYILLINSQYSCILFERVLKLIHVLLNTDKVYDKSKLRLRLHEMGYTGMFSLMNKCSISQPMIKLLIDQMMLSADSSQCYSGILSLLQLIQESDMVTKLETSRQLLQLLVSKSGAAKNFSKQLCWQEILCKLFISYPKTTNFSLGSFSQPILKISDEGTIRVGTPIGTNEITSKPGSTETENRTNRMFLDIPSSRSSGSLLSPNNTMGPPMYEQVKNDYWNLGEDSEERSMSRSSSTSAEDLSSLAQRVGWKGMEGLSNGLLSHSESMNDVPTVPEEEEEEILEESQASAMQAENFQRALDNLGIQKIYVRESVEKNEEFTQNMLIILLTIMWKGVDGSDTAAWKERGQVFSCLDKMNQSYELLRHPNELKRRLLEMMLHSCTSDLRESSQAFANHSENAIELIKIAQDFIIGNINGNDHVYSERLVEDIMTLLDALAVWDTQAESEWREMVHIGLRILLAFACQPELELCAVATARLHSLVQTRTLTSSAEASYLIGTLYDNVQKAIEGNMYIFGNKGKSTELLRSICPPSWQQMLDDLLKDEEETRGNGGMVLQKNAKDIMDQAENSDTYSFLIPVLKALIDKSYTLLNMEIYLPNLPATARSPTFFDDFRIYCGGCEWSNFVCTQINPQLQHFIEKIFLEHRAAMIEFWSECHESLMINRHKRNQEEGKSKLTFQSQIVDVAKHRISQEQRRFQNVTTQLRNQHNSTIRQWRATKRLFSAKRGAWNDKSTECKHWKLSNQENFSRMRVKLIPNYNFDPHTEPSKLRDNLDISEMADNDKLKKLELAKEALIAHENIADDTLGDEDWNVISSANTTGEEYSGKEKLVLFEECELITMVDVIKGRLEVTTTHVYFFDCSPYKEEGGEDFKWNLSQLREIHFRRYNLRRSALELFLIDQTNYFLNFEKKVRNKVYSRILSLRPPNLIYHGTRSPAELLKASGLTQTVNMTDFEYNIYQLKSCLVGRAFKLAPAEGSYLGLHHNRQNIWEDLIDWQQGLLNSHLNWLEGTKWVQREISNFEYLMQLNTIAGRTYNDLSQYPVFPWILCDYESEKLDLENKEIYRDLSKPIGTVNPKHEMEVREKFDLFEDPSGTVEKFHYGTHYSNAAGVQHFMIRMEPFTTLHIQLQSGRFDVADRQFHSIPASWQSVYENPNDVKELIPEFFYLPEFLYNSNNFDLGTLQNSKESVHHIVLPKWAKTAEEFIYMHKKALESDFVSCNLHHWIDLIFGYKQKGPPAIEALNVFYYCTYEGAVDLDAVKDPTERKALEGMINNFGQTPCQLLKELHPRRMTFDEVASRASKSEKPLSILYFINQLKTYFVEVSNENDPIVYISVPRIQTRSIIQHGMPDSMITITEDRILGIHGWLCYDKSISNYFTFERDPSLANNKTKKRLHGTFYPGLKIDPKLFVVSHDAKLLFIGGYWDNSLQVFHLSKLRKVNHIFGHIDIVTCLALDYCGSYLITGSKDTTCMIWKVFMQGGCSYSLSSKPSQILYGHDKEVTAVYISTELDMAVSASRDGTVIIHTVRKGHYMRTLQPPCEPIEHLHIPLLDVAENGQICIFCQQNQPSEKSDKYTLHLYTVNGKHLFQQKVTYPITDMIIKENYLISGNDQGHLTVYELFGLSPQTTVPLLVPIQCIASTPGNTHILVGLRDGKLIIVGTKSKAEIKNPPFIQDSLKMADKNQHSSMDMPQQGIRVLVS